MVAVRNGLVASMVALVLLLTVLGVTNGVGLVGWVAGLTCGTVLSVAVARSASSRSVEAFGPADLVTLARATLSCGAAALAAEAYVGDAPVWPLVALAAVALVLDAVDGRVARLTKTASGFGARLDGEADAFLMLVLSVYVAESLGAWVLMIGAIRYVFALAASGLPWMRAQLPPRYWRKVVTATAGITLTFAAAGIAAREAPYAALIVAAILLTESFGRDVWWLWRHRHRETASASLSPDRLRLPLP